MEYTYDSKWEAEDNQSPFTNMDWSHASNHMPSQVWNKITYPFPSFNCAAIEVCDRISNSILHFMEVIIDSPLY